MNRPPFTIGLIQMSVPTDRDAAVAKAAERVREAAKRGAQIICLQELFHAPYFCKVCKPERFDYAEPVTGVT